MLLWVLLILINMYILGNVMKEQYIYIENKETGEIQRIQVGPSGITEV